jgi:hypothetical protein
VWLWSKRWQTWLTHKLARPFLRLSGPKLRALRFRYEKVGLTVADEPIPWNAEAVLVEAVVWLPPGTVPRKSDFQLRTPDHVPRIAVALDPDSEQDAVHVVFRLPPIQGQTWAAIHYRGGMLGQLVLPFLTADAFFRNLCLRSPTLSALLVGQQPDVGLDSLAYEGSKYNVACQTLVEGQCRGLSAGGILASPTSLLPLSDFGLRVEITDRGNGCGTDFKSVGCGTDFKSVGGGTDFKSVLRVESVAVLLTGGQLLGKEASLSISLPPWPHRPGLCSVRWMLGERLLAHAEIRVVSAAAFQQSLYLAEGRFLSQGKQGGPTLFRHHLLARDDTSGLRPCFLIASREPGMAGLGALEIRVQFRDPNRRPLVCKQEMLLTDRPSLCIPRTVPFLTDFQQIRSFELLSKGHLLGTLPVSPTPVAAFTGEGGFHAPADFDWTPFTEEELFDRLEKLMEASDDSLVRSP